MPCDDTGSGMGNFGRANFVTGLNIYTFFRYVIIIILTHFATIGLSLQKMYLFICIYS